MASNKIVTISGDNFETEVLKADRPVLVDFWAPWCGPCRQVAPVLEEIAEELDGKVRIAKLNVDENQDIAVKYQVRGIPMFILFKGGQIADHRVGAAPKSVFQSFIEPHL